MFGSKHSESKELNLLCGLPQLIGLAYIHCIVQIIYFERVLIGVDSYISIISVDIFVLAICRPSDSFCIRVGTFDDNFFGRGWQ